SGHVGGDRARWLLRRTGAVGGQAQPRRQGLGPDDRRPRRHDGPDGFGGIRRTGVLPPHPLLVPGLASLAFLPPLEGEGFNRAPARSRSGATSVPAACAPPRARTAVRVESRATARPRAAPPRS